MRPWYTVQPLLTNGVIPGDDNTGKLIYNRAGLSRTMIETQGSEELRNLAASFWHNQGTGEIFFFREREFKIQVWSGLSGTLQEIPSADYATDVSIETIVGRPSLVSWGYIVVNEEALYNAAASRNFQLHHSEQPDLVIKILALAGVSMEDEKLFQASSALDGQNTQQENK